MKGIFKFIAFFLLSFFFSLQAKAHAVDYYTTCGYYIDDIKIASPVSCSSTLSLGNYVWLDANNNGIQDGSESGIAGVTVKLYYDLNNDNIPDGAAIASTTTDSNGGYTFNNLSAYGYIVSVVLPSGYTNSATTATSADPNNSTINDNNGVVIFNTNEIRSNSINLTATNNNVDFGLLTASLSLTASTGICAATNSNTYTLTGLASFTNAPSTGTLTVSVQGGHSVVFSAPFTSPLSYTLDGLIADGASRSVTATFSATSATASATYTAPSAIGSGFYNFPLNSFITDFYWGVSPYPQISWDNMYVPGLGGPYGVGGGIHDLDLSPSGVTNMAAFCAEMAEGADANNHLVNKYKVAPLENINRGRAGESGTESANIPSGGIGRVRAGMIRYLYDNYYTSTDANAWTASNAGAFQLAVWELLHEKYTSNNSFTITSASTNGFYVLATYNTASVTQAQGYLNAINTLNWTDAQWMSYKSTAWHVIALEANNDTNPCTPDGQDFLIAQPIVGACVLNLGNLVWFDTNNNGIKDAGERPLSGVTVNLYADANTDNLPDGASLATTVTNASGVYNFNNLPAGSYIVGITPPSGYVNSYTPSSGSTTNSDVDNDNNGVNTVGSEVRSNYITLSIGGEPASGVDGDGTNGNLTMDFGLKGNLQLGNLVWVDLNNNGIRDNGELGISGVTVNLYQDVNGDNLPDGAAIASTTTSSSGSYGFSNLLPGNYIVGAVLPANYTIATTAGTSSNPNNDTDDDNNGVTTASGEVRTNYITLTTGGEPTGGTYNSTLDIAFKPAQYIGDLVWIDANRNGVQDAVSTGEFGVPGVKVELYNTSNVLLQTTYTNFNGNYGFAVATGSYYVKFSGIPNGLVFTTQGGGTTSTDSDPNPATGITSTFTISSGQFNTTIDAGLKHATAVGNFVWVDTNANGQQDGGELGIPGVFVGLYNTSDVLVGGAITDNTGYYLINTVPGTYYLKINVPSGYNLTTQAAGGVPANLNSDANVTTFKTNNITLTTTADYDQDFGLVLKPNTVVSCGQVPLQVTEVSSNITLNKFVPAGYGTLTNVAIDYNALTVNPFIGIENTANGAQTYTLTNVSDAKLTLPNASTLIVSNGFATGPTAIGTYDGITDYQGTSGWNQINLAKQNSATSNPYTPTSDFLWTSGGTTISLPFVTSNNTVLSMTGGNNSFQIRTMSAAGACVSYTYEALNLGNTVWFDVNNNGIKDASETGVSGATVKIYADANADNTPDGAALSITTTNASGVYNFSNLPAGNYIVGVTLPTGYVATTTTVNSSNPNSDTDNDNNGVTTVSGELRSNYITLSIGGEPASGVDGDGTNGNLTLDFGIKGTLNLGNLVWNDTNGNGVKDAFESGINGVTVYLYQDANGDNVADGAAITSTTTAGGGIYSFTNIAPGNYIVGYLLPTGYANTFKPANNANPNSDTDGDNNGVTRTGNEVRSNYITLSVAGEPSTDGDGTNGNLTLDFGIAKDTDGDKIPDVIDIDDDNDGITDLNESGGYDPLADCDNDGIPNYLDSTPGCTTLTGNDPWGKPYTPLTWSDCNSDGVNDFFDWDRDGIINELDLDSDNDGILDVQEARPNGVAVTSTLNGMITGTDADGNGLLSSYENGNTNPVLNGIAAQDFDRDGTPNFLDLDSDGDGITDLTEALGVYSTTGVVSGTDTDGDGVRAESFGSSAATTADNINGFGAKGITLLDSDNDSRPNAYDIDSDNDGITDNAEGQATCSNKLPSGNDCDGDGVDDSYDAGGCSSCLRTSGGVTPFDKDADGTPDYLDLDTDNDGALDIYEGHSIPSANGNVPPANYWIAQIGDADKDGLLDYFDGLNILTTTGGEYWRNVINNNMGNNGGWDTGNGATGSITQLPKSQVSSDCSVGDRDWRNITILPASLVEFKGNLNNNTVNVTWIVTKETNLSHYEVERSINGTVFTKVTSVQAANAGVATVSYNAADDISGLTAATVYYRIKIVEKDGSFKHSNIISFKLGNKKAGIVVNPNPAISYFTLKITNAKEAVAIVKVVDMMGKTLITQTNKVMAGVNTYTFNNLSNFSAGTYSVQVIIDNQLYTDKLIVAKY